MTDVRAIAIFLASAAVSAALGSAAIAQVDPFASAAPPRPAGAAPAGPLANPVPQTAYAGGGAGNRTGFTGVEQAVGASYAGGRTKGFASTAQIRTLPRSLPPMSVSLKGSGQRNLKGRPRVAVPTYALAVIRLGEMRASGAGSGSDITPRATKISTVLTGVDDTLALKLAEEANADLVKRLTEAGIDVVPSSEVQASKELARLKPAGDPAKGVNGWQVYGAPSAPLRSGFPLTAAAMSASGAAIVFNDVSVELDAVMVSPYLAVNYAAFEGSGNRSYSGSASVEMNVGFSIASAGANFLYGAGKGKGGGIYGSFQAAPQGSDELFGVLYEVSDRSDDVAVNNAFASLGMGSIYRQSKYYAVEAVPERYAALVRAAYQGFNTALVAAIKQARA